jgi:hypothetical protein
MANYEVIGKVFKNQDYMTTEQQNIAEEFQQMIEAEYALCTSQMKKTNQLATSGITSTNSDEKISINYACLEIDAIREYWMNRLVAMMQIVEKRNPVLAKELASKYLNHE